MGFTYEQQQAIEKDGANILVSAAAGSGKTTVLVARIINKIVNKKIDIDKLLVVTFTNAAASEMKERLLKALYDEIDNNPDDVHLQKQINLINQAHISTISSFCLDVIRNNFFEIGMSANFRVGDPTEIEIIKQEAIEEVFENKYEEQDKDFLELLNMYTTYRDDEPLKQIILSLFDFISSIPYPHKWIENAVNDYNINTDDFARTKWGQLIIDRTKNIINDSLLSLNMAKNMLYGNSNLMDCFDIIQEDIVDFETLKYETWDDIYSGVNLKQWKPWSRKRKYEEGEKELKDKAKEIRDEVKNTFTKKVQKVFEFNSEDSIQDVHEMYETLKKIKTLLYEFEKEFNKRKKERNIVDFSDIEHLALGLLVDKDGNKTEIAKNYDFNEILVDEYQDSNLIQESILNAVANGNNTFMVGDVKQSIYRFRQARPDLFLDKYDKYQTITQSDGKLDKDTKIQLYKNFRSREEVLDITNTVFENIMSKKLGEINYNQEEYLNYSADFENPKINCKPELYIIDTTNKTDEEDEEKLEEDDLEILDNATLEARLACKKIKELHDENVEYKDIAILLRSPGNVANIYEKELTEAGIPVFSDATSEYLESIEIDTILSLLKIIDNPLQDIPLVTVMRSPIGGFDDNELIEIRLNKREGNFYYSLLESENGGNKELADKIKAFLELIDSFKKVENQLPLDELIWKIYSDTGYYHYVRLMPNGKLRQANLRKLFEKAKEYEKISFKGLFNFITFIEKVASKSSSNMMAAKIIGENDNVVRIMSVHKSKGLEFPIVILCGVEKKFNEQDMKSRIIYDQDLGIGMNYIKDTIEYSTLTKEAINIKAKRESMSEEMRILYVALTRAKEKLIIIGSDKNTDKNLYQKRIDIDKYHGKDKPEKLNNNLVEKYNRFLDWLELVYEYNPKANFEIKIINKEELKLSSVEEVKQIQNTRKIDNLKYEKIDKLLNWHYNYNMLVEAPSKTSVTVLKNSNLKFDDNQVILLDSEITEKHEKNIVKLDIDKNEDTSISPAQKGTLIHLLLQKLENNEIEKTIQSLKIKEEEKEFLNKNIKTIENYINSNLFDELVQAKSINKETPFYMNIKYKDTGENILVQGVIDLYYIDKNDDVVLVDYKTDRNVDETILKERYFNQLNIYKVALKQALNKDVKKCCIYSTFLNKIIEL